MSDLRSEFQNLLDSEGPSLLKLLQRLCRSSWEADDVFQETAIRVWNKIESLKRVNNIRGWISTIAYRAYIDLIARKKIKNETLISDPIDPSPNDPRKVAESRETNDRMDRAVKGLPDQLREIIVLHYTAGMPLSEIAGAIGLPAGTVKSRLHAALLELRRSLK